VTLFSAWVWALAAFVIIQACLVILQDVLGTTFFLPARVRLSSQILVPILKILFFQFAHAKAYDYHPPMPLPDAESPEKSLGDCAICMDAILVDPSMHRSKSFDTREDWDETGTSSSLRAGMRVGSMFNAMQKGVGATSARKNYSLAPCSHLFVSLDWFRNMHSNWQVLLLQHTECLEKVRPSIYHYLWSLPCLPFVSNSGLVSR